MLLKAHVGIKTSCLSSAVVTSDALHRPPSSTTHACMHLFLNVSIDLPDVTGDLLSSEIKGLKSQNLVSSKQVRAFSSYILQNTSSIPMAKMLSKTLDGSFPFLLEIWHYASHSLLKMCRTNPNPKLKHRTPQAPTPLEGLWVSCLQICITNFQISFIDWRDRW